MDPDPVPCPGSNPSVPAQWLCVVPTCDPGSLQAPLFPILKQALVFDTEAAQYFQEAGDGDGSEEQLVAGCPTEPVSTYPLKQAQWQPGTGKVLTISTHIRKPRSQAEVQHYLPKRQRLVCGMFGQGA